MIVAVEEIAVSPSLVLQDLPLCELVWFPFCLAVENSEAADSQALQMSLPISENHSTTLAPYEASGAGKDGVRHIITFDHVS
jgi:hypothetical protein